ncbi:MAG TPA: type II toxin-antitoxin system PemK/MazF family toxin [Microthrixaceae bacterium]|nr:type II toxin-antitoxin system PemK/MazF family toxin [Microthrixaceae bacterium]HMT25164.1 type II toxin-antitoxin system PemK/MazF family toxin [Microthrixaceae bacterium]HMT63002.1 type II toxin-antitoxin system PemK/MazF family toxin [Microthrixaceae bacterium]
MSAAPTQGEVWWAEAEDKRRPVLIVTRSDAVPVLTWIVVAPVTRTIREIPTEVRLGASHGLPEECVASFDNLQPIRRSFLTRRAGELQADEADEICRALRALADC